MADQNESNVNTGGGAAVGGNASVSNGDFVGRDKIHVDLLGDNRTKQYEAVIAATRRGATDPSELFFVGFDLSGRNLIDFQLPNAQLNNIPNDRIRYIVDDCLKFVQREQRRGKKYDAIMQEIDSQMANIDLNKKNIISDCRGMILILKEKLAEMKIC